jgi:hypothetical protein
LQIALSDAVFKGLESQLDEMGALKEEREARLAEMHEVLDNMWNMLEIPGSDENRAFFEKMIQAPASLHSHTLDKVCSTASVPFITVLLFLLCLQLVRNANQILPSHASTVLHVASAYGVQERRDF